jgi:hypothetical protein
MEATRNRLTGPAARKKLLGSVAVLGVAAAVAGFGSYSTFNDTTTPVNTQITSGVLSLSLKDNGAVATVPFAGGTFLAGDSHSKPLDLVNDGDTAHSSVTMTTSATTSSALDTDQTNGLQLTVTSCSVPWTASGSSWSCSGTTRGFYTGPIVTSSQALTSAASLAVGGVDHLLLTALLPSTASGASFQNASSTLSFVFTGSQRSGSAH